MACVLEAAPGPSTRPGCPERRLWRGPARVRRSWRSDQDVDSKRMLLRSRSRARGDGIALRCSRRSSSSSCQAGTGGGSPGPTVSQLSRTKRGQPSHPASVRTRAVHAAARTAKIAKQVNAAHAAPQLRDPPAGAEHRYPRDPGPARARQLETSSALYTRVATNTIRAVMSPRSIGSRRCG